MNPVHKLIPSEIIRTPRLWLKALNPEVMGRVYDTLTDDELFIFFGHNTQQDMERERDKYTRGLTTHQITYLNYLLIERETGFVIGRCGFHTWYVPHNRAEIGYHMVDETKKGKGFMKEALAAIINHGFMELGLNRIEAFVGAANAASLRLVASFGFVREGILREHYHIGGKHEDSLCFSLLRREYTGQ
ncbi:MAG: GNAT family N-acetyltransferase [Taibaiella sp.]|nr:GNAT family N-acetyltransferase [Taibaiella sp.]